MENSTDTRAISQDSSLGADTVQFIFLEISESLGLKCDPLVIYFGNLLLLK